MIIKPFSQYLAGIVVTCGLVSAQPCGSETVAKNSLMQQIERDKTALKRLGFDADAYDLSSLASSSKEQQAEMVRVAFNNLLDGLTGAALDKTGEVAGEALKARANLPNGYASLNPFNVNTYIKRLDNPEGPVAALLRQVASSSQKAAKLTLLQELPDAVEQEKGAYDLLYGESSTRSGSLTAYLNLTKTLAELGGYSQAAAAVQIGTTLADVFVAYATLMYGEDALSKLNQLTVDKARALARLSTTLRDHVIQLKIAEGRLAVCRELNRPVTERWICDGTNNPNGCRPYSCKGPPDIHTCTPISR